MKTIIIIGAGPAGLTAAVELLERGTDCAVTVVEESETFGGISKTLNFGGNRMDIGGHRFFSKDGRVNAWWSHFLQPQSSPSKDDILLGRDRALDKSGLNPETDDAVMLTRERVSRIYYRNVFFDYPVTLSHKTIRSMGPATTLRAGLSYLPALVRKLPEDNLENFYINRFGRVLYSMFFEGYTEKLWGRHPRDISADWGAQRIKGLSVSALLGNIFGGMFGVKAHKTETSLIERFGYPKYGPGQLWELAAERVRELGGVIITGKRVTKITRNDEGDIVSVGGDGFDLPCDTLISSMPISDLCAAMSGVPADIAVIAEGLPFRDFQTVGVLLPSDKFRLRNLTAQKTVGGIAPDCWIYVQDPSVKLGRIQVFNNWSPYLVKDFEHTVWLGLEYFCSEGDQSWQQTDDEYTNAATRELLKIGVIADKSDVIFTSRVRVKKAYPAYFGSYARFGELREYLDQIGNLYCVGRNGQHRYNNMDHSMVTAFRAVDAILAGGDKSAVWNVNVDDEYHEVKSE
ncbi:MAG: NAD(P)/FAD-dependent oxidoreductase [Oscillospiraceae bacterium]|jgi:protoporphyrinogen oxidase|nr:NAD(P)/FAD-dependent oxidoreductase [Oscillospiraceae bacterium]